MNNYEAGLLIKEIVPESRADEHNKISVRRGNFHLVILTGMIIEGVNDAQNVSGQKLQRALLEARSGPITLWIRRADKPPKGERWRASLNRSKTFDRADSDVSSPTRSSAWNKLLDATLGSKEEKEDPMQSHDLASTLPPNAMRNLAVRFQEMQQPEAARTVENPSEIVKPFLSKVMANAISHLDDDPLNRSSLSMLSMSFSDQSSLPASPQVSRLPLQSRGQITGIAIHRGGVSFGDHGAGSSP